MKIGELDSIEQIGIRICELQKAHISLQEQFKSYQNNTEHSINESALRVINILDMIETTKSNVDLDSVDNLNFQRTIKKIEKRLIDILRYWQIEEIVFKDGQIEVGRTRVLGTRKASGEILAGNVILDVCRKGYQRGGKTIRPADIITAEGK